MLHTRKTQHHHHHHKQQLYSRLPELVCVSLLVMWGQGSEVTASPQPLTDATFKTLPVSDVIFADDLLQQKRARSHIDCGRRCLDEARCAMFTFHPGAPKGPHGDCLIHSQLQSLPASTAPAPGALSFSRHITVWIKNNCSNSSDCAEPMAACFSGQCLCDQGYFFDHTLNACVKSCDRGKAPSYLHYKDVELFGSDLFYNNSILSPTPCEAACIAMPTCSGFSYYPPRKRCYYKSLTARDLPRSWQPKANVVYYQRTCY